MPYQAVPGRRRKHNVPEPPEAIMTGGYDAFATGKGLYHV